MKFFRVWPKTNHNRPLNTRNDTFCFMKYIAILAMLALAGCAEAPEVETLTPENPDETSENNGFAPQGTQIETYEDDISLVGNYDACEAGWCLDLVATNEGSTTYHVDAICANPFSDSMEQDGKTVQHRELTAQCAAFGTEPFAPGAMLSWQFTWDGQIYTENHPSPANGDYQWSGHFRAYNQPDGGQGPLVTVTHTIVIGAT